MGDPKVHPFAIPCCPAEHFFCDAVLRTAARVPPRSRVRSTLACFGDPCGAFGPPLMSDWSPFRFYFNLKARGRPFSPKLSKNCPQMHKHLIKNQNGIKVNMWRFKNIDVMNKTWLAKLLCQFPLRLDTWLANMKYNITEQRANIIINKKPTGRLVDWGPLRMYPHYRIRVNIWRFKNIDVQGPVSPEHRRECTPTSTTLLLYRRHDKITTGNNCLN